VKRLLILPFVVAVALSACAAVETKVEYYAQQLVNITCKQSEDIRKIERKRLWILFGVDTSQVCIPKADRVKPPTIP